jgi:potassium voltage-gated channel delayed-rectifier subfamily S protein 3
MMNEEELEKFIMDGNLKSCAEFSSILHLDQYPSSLNYFDVEKSNDVNISLLNESKIKLNARGIRYEVPLKTFNKFPNSRLGKLYNLLVSSQRPSHLKLMQLCDGYSLEEKEFYFNRDPFILNSILNLYSSNNLSKMHLNDGVCSWFLCDEMAFWGLDYQNEESSIIEKCCQIYIGNKTKQIQDELEIDEKVISDLDFQHNFGKIFFPRIRETLFNYMEKPLNSYIGKVSKI